MSNIPICVTCEFMLERGDERKEIVEDPVKVFHSKRVEKVKYMVMTMIIPWMNWRIVMMVVIKMVDLRRSV